MVVMKRERDDDDYSDGEDGFTMNDSTHLAAMGTMEVTMEVTMDVTTVDGC